MRRILNVVRLGRLIAEAREAFDLDLSGISVLTEAASGPFVVTPIIAALAGASRVVACTRDSRHGAAREVAEYTTWLARELGAPGVIEITTRDPRTMADGIDLVTNLGFVRPIDAALLKELSPCAAVALMWEPWEFRSEDLDREACNRFGVPVLGTDEGDPRLRTMDYLGPLVLKLLMEAEIELVMSRIVVIGSDPFASVVVDCLRANRADVGRIDPSQVPAPTCDATAMARAADAIVVVEHRCRGPILGAGGLLPVGSIRQGSVVVPICGTIDHQALRAAGVAVIPPEPARPGFMTVTTDYLGPRPVVDLHTAGLKVGRELVVGRRQVGSAEATTWALSHSPALDWDN